MAQNSSVRDEQCLEYMCDSEGKPLALCATMPDGLITEDQALEEVADSGLLLPPPSDPNSAILLSPMESPCRKVEHGLSENRFMKELDFTEPHDDEAFGYVRTVSQTGIKRRYWSSSLLRDLLAVAAPVVPTIMWAFSTQRGGANLIYNIRALHCGCCLVALHSLHRTPFNIKT